MTSSPAPPNTRLCLVVIISSLLLGQIANGAEKAWPEPGVTAGRKIDASQVTYFVSPNGSDKQNGRSRATAFATMQHAADVVKPGQVVLVTRGVYHQNLHIAKEGRPDAWIVIEGEPGATIDGAEIRKDWKAAVFGSSIYSIGRPALLNDWQKPDTSLQNRMEQVFVNGRLLRQVSEREMLKPKNVFWVDDTAKKLYVCLANGANPNNQRTEVSTLTYAVAVGAPGNLNWWTDEKIGSSNKAAYIKIDGFTVRHIADFPRMAAIEVRGICHDITIENCDVGWASYCGIAGDSVRTYDKSAGKWFDDMTGNVIIRHCRISNNGCEAIGGGEVTNELVEGNLIENNNYKGVSPWNEGGGVKICEVGSTTYRNNALIDNDDEGLWFDTGYTNCVIENNFIYGSLAAGILDEVTPAPPVVKANGGLTYPALSAAQVHALDRSGTFKGTTIRNNIIVGTRAPGGYGIAIATSPRAIITNNILYGNSGSGISDGGSPVRPDTLGLWGTRVEHNISDNNFGHIAAMTDASDPGGRFFDNRIQDNLFLRSRSGAPFNVDGKDVATDRWRQVNGDAADVYAQNSIFKDPEHLDFTIIDPVLARRVGFDPKAIRLNWKEFLPAPAQQETRLRARVKPGTKTARVFDIVFDGDVDATGSDGGEIDAQGYNPYAFDAGSFIDDPTGSAFVPAKPLFYTTPADFPLGGRGTISLWLKSDDWATADRISQNKTLDYTRTMVPLSTDGTTARYAPWSISFEVDKLTLRQLNLEITVAGESESIDVTSLIKPGQWFNLAVVWQPREDGHAGTLRRTFLSGHLLSEKTFDDVPNVVGNKIYVGVPSNGGQPWRGSMGNLTIENVALSSEQASVLADRTRSKKN